MIHGPARTVTLPRGRVDSALPVRRQGGHLAREASSASHCLGVAEPANGTCCGQSQCDSEVRLRGLRKTSVGAACGPQSGQYPRSVPSVSKVIARVGDSELIAQPALCTRTGSARWRAFDEAFSIFSSDQGKCQATGWNSGPKLKYLFKR